MEARTAAKASPLRALVINCTLKPSPQPFNTEALAATVITALHDWAASTGRAMASHLVHAARASAEHPLTAPPS